jgi:hypothetical protein
LYTRAIKLTVAPVQQTGGRIKAHLDVTQQRLPLLFKVLQRKSQVLHFCYHFDEQWQHGGECDLREEMTCRVCAKKLAGSHTLSCRIVTSGAVQRRAPELMASERR